MQPESTTETRASLIYRNIEHIEMVYEKAASSGTADPVVLVLDTRDPLCRAIATNSPTPWARHVEQVNAECDRDGLIPTAYAVLPRWTAVKLLRGIQRCLASDNSANPVHSQVVDALKSPPPPEMFYCIAISYGKVIVSLPKPGSSTSPRMFVSADKEDVKHVICEAYREAVAARTTQPVVILFDLDTPLGRFAADEMALPLGGHRLPPDGLVVRAASTEALLNALQFVDRKHGRSGDDATMETLRTPPPGHFWMLAFNRAGKMLAPFPVPANG